MLPLSYLWRVADFLLPDHVCGVRMFGNILFLLLAQLPVHRSGGVIAYTDGHGYEPWAYGVAYRYENGNVELDTTTLQVEKTAHGTATLYTGAIRYRVHDHLTASLRLAAVDYSSGSVTTSWQPGLGWKEGGLTLGVDLPDNTNYKTRSAWVRQDWSRFSIRFWSSQADFQGEEIVAAGVDFTVWVW